MTPLLKALSDALHQLHRLESSDPLVNPDVIANIRQALAGESDSLRHGVLSKGWTAASLTRALVDGNGPRDPQHPIFAAFKLVEEARAQAAIASDGERPLLDTTMGQVLVSGPTGRDPRAPQSYWEAQVANTRDWVAGNAQRLDRPVEKWRNAAAYAVAADDSVLWAWHLFSTLYSAGASRESLRIQYIELLGIAERAASIVTEHMDAKLLHARESGPGAISTYAAHLRLVALAHVFDVDDPTFDRVVAAIRLSWGDRLVDRFIAARRPDQPIGDKLRHPKAVAHLDEVWDSLDPERAMTTYLATWYRSWKGVKGWGGHDFQDRMDYFGYWAFEAAGAVAVLGMDGARFADREYYPADLLL